MWLVVMFYLNEHFSFLLALNFLAIPCDMWDLSSLTRG